MLAAEVLAAAEARADRDLALFGNTNLASSEHYQGKFAPSLAHCERAIELYDAAQHHGLVRRIAGDQGVVALNFSAHNLWFLGQPDAALARACEAGALTRRLEDPFSLAFALVFEALVHCVRRDVAAQRERAAEVVALSEAQGFPAWLGGGRALHAAARVLAGDPAALPEIMGGIVLAAETGNQSGASGIFAILAEAQRAAGQLAERRARSRPPSPLPASRAPARSSCAPRRASPASGAIRASAPRRATSSPRSTPGSPKASTPAT